MGYLNFGPLGTCRAKKQVNPLRGMSSVILFNVGKVDLILNKNNRSNFQNILSVIAESLGDERWFIVLLASYTKFVISCKSLLSFLFPVQGPSTISLYHFHFNYSRFSKGLSLEGSFPIAEFAVWSDINCLVFAWSLIISKALKSVRKWPIS